MGCAMASALAGVEQPIRFGEGYEVDRRPPRLRRGSQVRNASVSRSRSFSLPLEHRDEIVEDEVLTVVLSGFGFCVLWAWCWSRCQLRILRSWQSKQGLCARTETRDAPACSEAAAPEQRRWPSAVIVEMTNERRDLGRERMSAAYLAGLALNASCLCVTPC